MEEDITTDIESYLQRTDNNNLIIPAGSLIKFGGMPFELKQDTSVEGLWQNLELAFEIEQRFVEISELGTSTLQVD